MGLDIAATLQKLDASAQNFSTRLDALEQRRDPGVVGTRDNFPGAPRARTGESILSSRGFSFGKAVGAVTGCMDREDAKIEGDFCRRLMKESLAHGYRAVDNHSATNGILCPLWPEGFNRDQLSETMYNEMKSLMSAGVEGADMGEAAWLMKKYFGGKAAASPAQSWVDSGYGGTLVPPATFGPPIELLRNTAALMKAGATVVPLGPSGRLQMPRLTKATQGGWSGENVQQTPTQAYTGLLTLSAKKVIGVVVLPGELLRFGSPAAEGLIRSDLFKTVSLIADEGFLSGQGSDNVPLGLQVMGANTSGSAYVAPSSTNNYGTSGLGIALPYIASNLVAPQNVYDFIAAIEENNATATGWIMRPQMCYAFFQSRSTTYSGANGTGQFMFDLIRTAADGMTPVLAGLPVTKSAQVSKTLGTGNQTYILCGQWDDYLMGLFGAIEFTQTDAGYTMLSSDQVAIRAILTCDGGPRHPGAFSYSGLLTNGSVSP